MNKELHKFGARPHMATQRIEDFIPPVVSERLAKPLLVRVATGLNFLAMLFIFLWAAGIGTDAPWATFACGIGVGIFIASLAVRVFASLPSGQFSGEKRGMSMRTIAVLGVSVSLVIAAIGYRNHIKEQKQAEQLSTAIQHLYAYVDVIGEFSKNQVGVLTAATEKNAAGEARKSK